MKKSVTRLFDGFKPTNYQLRLELNPEIKKFKGMVIIKGHKNGRPSKRLTLHQKDLKITDTKVTKHDRSGDTVINLDRVNTHKSYDEVRLHSNGLMYPGEYTITVQFEGKITDPMNGLYPCYFTHNNKKKMLIATQFESHHAREVFPCIDEPEAKATFDLTLVTPNEGKVIANTPIKKQEVVSDEWLVDRKVKLNTTHYPLVTTFEQTPIMSTYLLAFVFGEIGHLEAKTKRGTLVRTFATPDNVKFTQFALDTAVKCLEYYEDYFAIPFPLAKSDMIALPDFASGAMENWGLITYREQTLLVDPKNTSLGTKQYVAMVVAHELAHQWFGNLVTMRWWTDLWLNEGFASWIEYLACNEIFPDWQMWTQFAASEQQPAFRLDALDNTHPIEVPIHHPDEIRSIFDTISYSKGASVIHMLFGYLGEKDFRDGLRHYLKKHKFGNADTKDLWSALEEISGKPVKKFMHTWTSLPGYPVVHVELDKTEVNLSQERFYMQKPTKVSATNWPIPLLTHNDAPERLDSTHTTYSSSSFTKLNVGQSGFYRTVYNSAALGKITKQIIEMDPIDRLGLLADAFDSSKAGYGPTINALTLLEHYQDEDNAAVWEIISSNIVELRRTMDDDTFREAFKPYVRRLSGKQLARLGWEELTSDSYFDKLLRPTILGLASSSDEPSVVNEAIHRFDSAKTTEDIAADLRGMVYTTAAREGNEVTFKKLLKFHNESDSSEERTTLTAALTAFKQPALYKKALSLITTDKVRRQDAMYWLAYSFMNRHAKVEAWQWMRDNWNWLEENLGSDLSFFRTPIYAARSFSNKEFLKEYDDFFNPKASPGMERSIKQGREMLEWQIAWKKRDLDSLLKYLA
jgi:puromycin-sensitive aminopeptidase